MPIIKARSSENRNEGAAVSIQPGASLATRGGYQAYDDYLNTTPSNVFAASRFATQAASGDVGASASGNGPATVTYAAETGKQHMITGVAWSYSLNPVNGGLRIEDGANNIVFRTHITSAGAGFFEFPGGKLGTVSTLMRITLDAGGTGASGTISVLGHKAI